MKVFILTTIIQTTLRIWGRIEEIRAVNEVNFEAPDPDEKEPNGWKSLVNQYPPCSIILIATRPQLGCHLLGFGRRTTFECAAFPRPPNLLNNRICSFPRKTETLECIVKQAKRELASIPKPAAGPASSLVISYCWK
jgi:hypothetical protein